MCEKLYLNKSIKLLAKHEYVNRFSIELKISMYNA